MNAVVDRHRTYGSTWSAGDALWWREDDGTVHCFVQVRAVDRGPRGGLRGPGETAAISAPSLAAVNRELAALGFVPARVHVGALPCHPARPATESPLGAQS